MDRRARNETLILVKRLIRLTWVSKYLLESMPYEVQSMKYKVYLTAIILAKQYFILELFCIADTEMATEKSENRETRSSRRASAWPSESRTSSETRKLSGACFTQKDVRYTRIGYQHELSRHRWVALKLAHGTDSGARHAQCRAQCRALERCPVLNHALHFILHAPYLYALY